MTTLEKIQRAKQLKAAFSNLWEPKDLALFDYAVKALEQEPCRVKNELNLELNELNPCDDAISRDMALEKMVDYVASGYADSAEDFEEYSRIICQLPSVRPQEPKWIPVSERLPEDFGTYLITLENGDVCQCEFNPDFIDEEHENGAFTYYHQYFDQATLGMIDEEEEAVDAIAWMLFEPYEPKESEE